MVTTMWPKVSRSTYSSWYLPVVPSGIKIQDNTSKLKSGRMSSSAAKRGFEPRDVNWCKAHQEETKPTIKRTHVVIPLTDADTFQLCDKCRPLVYGGDRTSPSSSVDMKVMT